MEYEKDGAIFVLKLILAPLKTLSHWIVGNKGKWQPFSSVTLLKKRNRVNEGWIAFVAGNEIGFKGLEGLLREIKWRKSLKIENHQIESETKLIPEQSGKWNWLKTFKRNCAKTFTKQTKSNKTT